METASTGYAMTGGAGSGITVQNLWTGVVMRKGELMSDLIDRQAVLDALTHKWDGMVTSVFDVVKSLPSTQPEIIHCRDCKYWNPNSMECEGIGNWFGCTFLHLNQLSILICQLHIERIEHTACQHSICVITESPWFCIAEFLPLISIF